MTKLYLTTDGEYRAALARLDALGVVSADTPAADELKDLMSAIEIWEMKHPETETEPFEADDDGNGQGMEDGSGRSG